MPGNSKAKADRGEPYVPEKKPTNPIDAIDILFMWGYYMQKWGERVHASFHHLGDHTQHPPGLPMMRGGGKGEKGSDSKIVTHLDPPPPPWDE